MATKDKFLIAGVIVAWLVCVAHPILLVPFCAVSLFGLLYWSIGQTEAGKLRRAIRRERRALNKQTKER